MSQSSTLEEALNSSLDIASFVPGDSLARVEVLVVHLSRKLALLIHLCFLQGLQRGLIRIHDELSDGVEGDVGKLLLSETLEVIQVSDWELPLLQVGDLILLLVEEGDSRFDLSNTQPCFLGDLRDRAVPGEIFGEVGD